MTNNKAYDFFFKIKRNNEVTEIQIVDSLNIPVEQYCHTQIYELHKILKIALSITLSPESCNSVLDSEVFSAIISVTNLFSIN